MTVGEIRTKMYGVVQKVFTEDFNNHFNSIAAQMTPVVAETTMKSYESHIDQYILLASMMVDRPEALAALAKVTNPLIAWGVFMRYDALTQFFLRTDQNNEIDLPDDDGDFFSVILISLYGHMFGSGRSK